MTETLVVGGICPAGGTHRPSFISKFVVELIESRSRSRPGLGSMCSDEDLRTMWCKRCGIRMLSFGGI